MRFVCVRCRICSPHPLPGWRIVEKSASHLSASGWCQSCSRRLVVAAGCGKLTASNPSQGHPRSLPSAQSKAAKRGEVSTLAHWGWRRCAPERGPTETPGPTAQQGGSAASVACCSRRSSFGGAVGMTSLGLHIFFWWVVLCMPAWPVCNRPNFSRASHASICSLPRRGQAFQLVFSPSPLQTSCRCSPSASFLFDTRDTPLLMLR